MYCSNCGNKMDNQAKFCVHCGAKSIIEMEEEDSLKDIWGEESQEKNIHTEVNTQANESQNPQKNGMAIAGFVGSFFIPLLGWIFGGIGLARAGKREGKGKGFSIAAIAIASGMFLLNLM